jgi:hypothetical protein
MITDNTFLVRRLDDNNDVLAIYDDMVKLSYKRAINSIGMAAVTVADDHPLLEDLELDHLIDIQYSYPSSDASERLWKTDFVGLFRDEQIATTQDGLIYHVLFFQDLNEILSRFVVAYRSEVANRTQWTATDISQIIDDVVKHNCTTSATTAAGRLRDATVIAGLVTGTTLTTESIDYGISPGRNALDIVQELAHLRLDFQVEIDGDHVVFNQYERLGIDRSESTIFQLELDNISDANLSFDRLREKTVAIVGGRGENVSRDFVVRLGPNFQPDNEYEFFVNASDKEANELSAIGDSALLAAAARVQINGTVSPSLGYVYGRDYGFGDLVTVSFAGFSEVKRINKVQIDFEQDAPAIQLEMVAI